MLLADWANKKPFVIIHHKAYEKRVLKELNFAALLLQSRISIACVLIVNPSSSSW